MSDVRETIFCFFGPLLGLTESLLGVLGEVDVSCKTVFLVGHNPSLTDFINSICTYSLDNLPSGGMFCADFRILSWREIDQQKGQFIFVDFPK